MQEYVNKTKKWYEAPLAWTVIAVVIAIVAILINHKDSNATGNQLEVIANNTARFPEKDTIKLQSNAAELKTGDQKKAETLLADPSLTNIKPEEIEENIRKAPAYQKDEVAENFIGLKVSWKATLFAIYKENKKGDSVTVVLKAGISPNIWCDVNINRFPLLKIANDNSLWLISGKIKHCRQTSITLDIQSLEPL